MEKKPLWKELGMKSEEEWKGYLRERQKVEIEERVKARRESGIEQFQIWAAYRGEGKGASIERLKENVNALCHMVMQKTGGQPKYAHKGDLPLDMLLPIRWGIITGAIALVLSGTLDGIKDEATPLKAAELKAASEHWRFLMPGELSSNISTLVVAVHKLATIVKYTGYDKYAEEYERLKWVITCEATALVLSGNLDGVKVNSDSAKRHRIPDDLPLPVKPHKTPPVCRAVTLTQTERRELAIKLATTDYEIFSGFGSLVDPELTEKEQTYLEKLLH